MRYTAALKLHGGRGFGKSGQSGKTTKERGREGERERERKKEGGRKKKDCIRAYVQELLIESVSVSEFLIDKHSKLRRNGWCARRSTDSAWAERSVDPRD